MTNKELKIHLKSKIYTILTPLIGKKCILLDAPYYHNIGDVLIWEGTKSFIKENNINCIYTAFYETYSFPKIDKTVTILFNGGGNLGDIYHEHVEFLLKVTTYYPNNRIIILPQTIYYQDKNKEQEDLSKLLNHKDLYICTRDKEVYKNISLSFQGKTLLLPDMAFCINDEFLSAFILPEQKRKLIIDRNDCEKNHSKASQIALDGDISDWPVFEHSFRRTTFINKILKKISDAKIPLISKLNNKVWDIYAQNIFCKAMVREGVKFISPYSIVETTRLHGCILSILLNKKVILVNNSYGKNKNFYDTWLKDIDTLTLKQQS